MHFVLFFKLFNVDPKNSMFVFSENTNSRQIGRQLTMPKTAVKSRVLSFFFQFSSMPAIRLLIIRSLSAHWHSPNCFASSLCSFCPHLQCAVELKIRFFSFSFAMSFFLSDAALLQIDCTIIEKRKDEFYFCHF